MSKEQKILASMYEVQEELQVKKVSTNRIDQMVKELEEFIKREQLIPLM